jgi:hypothetical protein
MLDAHMRAPVSALLVVAGLLWVIGSNAWSGPVVMVLSEHHGVHLHDWLSLVLWGGAAGLVVPRTGDGRTAPAPAELLHPA